MKKGERKGDTNYTKLLQGKGRNHWKGACSGDSFQVQEAGRPSRQPQAPLSRPTCQPQRFTLLRCGFLMMSYPRFFRSKARTGRCLEWHPRVGANSAQHGRAPQALRDRGASRVPVPSAAPMVLVQTWYRERPRSGCLLASQDPRASRPPGLSRTRVLQRGQGHSEIIGATPPVPEATCSALSAYSGPGTQQSESKVSHKADRQRVTISSTPAPIQGKKWPLRGQGVPGPSISLGDLPLSPVPAHLRCRS
jgi:hypothetical protein